MTRSRLAAALAGAVLLVACENGSTEPPRAGVPQLITYAAGGGQHGFAGEPLEQPLVVRVLDGRGQPAPGAVVTFATRDSTHGFVTPARATADAQGRVSVSWRLGRHAGEDTVTATSELAGGPIVFTAIAHPNGVISGTVTTDGVLPVFGGVRVDADPAVAGLPVLALQQAEGDGGASSPTALVVHFRAERIGAPRVGAAAHRSRGTAGEVSRSMRGRLSPYAKAGFRLRDLSPAVLAARIEVEAGRADAVRAALLADPAVADVRPDAYAYLAAARIPDDALWPAQQWHYGMVDLPRAWRIATGSAQVLGAVVDDGIRFDHPDLAPNLTADGYDFVSASTAPLCAGGTADLTGDGDGYDPDPTLPVAYARTGACVRATPVGGHGLHVAGTVGAVGDNEVGVAGVSWAVRIRPVRVMNASGRGTYFDIAQGLLYAAGLPASDGGGGTVQAATGARVINLSLGGSADDPVLRDAVRAAHAAGALIVASAMNASNSTPFYPAAYPEVVSVAAVSPRGMPAFYSNFGPTVDIAAPGGDHPQGGGNNPSFMIGSTSWSFADGTPAYAFLQGTSMAAPHVTGVAALLLAHEPALTVEQLRARLLDYATDAGTPGRDDRYGAGILNARNSLTATHAPARALTAVLYDAASGARLQSVSAPGGTFRFAGLADGAYRVAAGEDEDGDGLLGVPDRRWGVFGGVGTPAAVQVRGAFTYAASFSIAYPTEVEGNGDVASAHPLLLGGYYDALLADADDADFYRVVLPVGTYTFATEGRGGGCRHTLGADTHLTLYTVAGAVVATADDPDPAARRYCAALTQTLAAGTYTLAVRASAAYPGRYAVAIRPAW
jgi:subtilisin family serine protease